MPPVTRLTTNTAEVDPSIETEVLWMKYKTPIIALALLLLVGGALYGGYVLYTNHRDDAAATELAQAKDLAGYQKVLSDYSNAPAASSAALMAAAEQRKAKQFAESNTTLQKFISSHPKHELATTAQMAVAANLDSLGKPDEAMAQYQRVAAEHPRDYNAPFALLGQVPLLKAKGQIDQARQVCETVLTQYRESEASGEASRYLRTLKSPVAAAPVASALPASTVAPATPTPTASVAAAASASPSAKAKK